MKKEQLDNLRHSCAHLLAAAVMELYPQVKRTIGPAIENGFYYDFDFGDVKISEDELSKIEKKMQELLPSWEEFEREQVSAKQAKELYKGNEYKLELIDEFAKEGQTLTFYKSGNYTDLCRGGHSSNPKKELKHFKLLSVAGAYWRGSEKNKMLTRIYGTCFPTKDELMKHLKMLEEAKKRDHRKLGKELGLFVFSDLVGSGLPMFTPKGAIVRKELEKVIAELREERNFERVWIPHIAKADLYKTSGHWDKFEDDLFHVNSKKTDTPFVLKPMNCPHHTQIYASKSRSHKDMPVRYFETTTIYRDENTGQIQGLTRVRSITQDDSHVFCRDNQIKQEAKLAYDIIKNLYKKCGMELKVRLSAHDPKSMDKYLGTEEQWQNSENELRGVIEEEIELAVGVGEATFYGPKLDFMAVDSLGREWQMATIQLDYNMPARFGLKFVNEKGEDEQPVMIHVAVLGSVERFMGVLIEHTAGSFPVWLSPIQVQLLPVSEKHVKGAEKILEELKTAGVRAELDAADETIGNKVRKAVKQKIPYVVVLGDRELEGEEWTVRVRGQADQLTISKEKFLERVKREIADRS